MSFLVNVAIWSAVRFSVCLYALSQSASTWLRDESSASPLSIRFPVDSSNDVRIGPACASYGLLALYTNVCGGPSIRIHIEAVCYALR